MGVRETSGRLSSSQRPDPARCSNLVSFTESPPSIILHDQPTPPNAFLLPRPSTPQLPGGATVEPLEGKVKYAASAQGQL